ncbi:PPC domain-containing protein [Aggregatilinea lenta]|uniref:PPC domain-containing protein n=1 Tax=Aggregatilinea lenta TaxID=913108 RepID=UPI000E5AF969|nr:PPC domain-containing protein [Aggregatilinea lenta]
MGFEDLDDLSELDEMPPFEEDLDLPGFEEPDEGGISRTFKIVGALLMLAVIAIVGILIVLALGGGDEVSPNELTSTAVIQTNTAVAMNFGYTQTAAQIAFEASQTAVREFELAGTVTQNAIFEAQTQSAANAAATATAEAQLTQTAVAAATSAAEQAASTAAARQATQTAQAEANDATGTAVAQSNGATQTAVAVAARLSGHLVDESNNPFSGVTIRLYRDDGDGVFTPSDVTTVTIPEEGTPLAVTGVPFEEATAGATEEAPSIAYGEAMTETLEDTTPVEWVFDGSAGDVVTVSAVAGDEVSMDMFVEMVGPDGTIVAEDDDSGDGLNALIENFELPEDGTYALRVSSVSGPGDYTLTLTTPNNPASAGPEPEATADAGATEEAGGAAYHPSGGEGHIVLVSGSRQGAQPTPTIELGDEFIGEIITGEGGEFDFGSLEPGVYWLLVDYTSLPADIQAQIPPTDEVLIQVNVPTAGEITFTVGIPPTPTPDLEGISATMTALAELGVSPTTPPTLEMATEEAGVEALPSALPTTGFFSDIADQAGDIDGTNGLTLLAIAAAGLVSVVVIARKLRTPS